MNLSQSSTGFVNKIDNDHEIAMACDGETMEFKIKCKARDLQKK